MLSAKLSHSIARAKANQDVQNHKGIFRERIKLFLKNIR